MYRQDLQSIQNKHVVSNVVQCPTIKLGVTSGGSCVCSTVSNMDACSHAQHLARQISSESNRTPYPQNPKAWWISDCFWDYYKYPILLDVPPSGVEELLGSPTCSPKIFKMQRLNVTDIRFNGLGEVNTGKKYSTIKDPQTLLCPLWSKLIHRNLFAPIF
jgi:hypothetical protein